MIHGIGTDIVAIARLRDLWDRHGEQAARKLLAPAEIPELAAAADKGRFLAKRFAAKEAFAKALGTGLRPPATLTRIAVTHDAAGKPAFAYAEVLTSLMESQGLRAHLSISDEADYAVAHVILERP